MADLPQAGISIVWGMDSVEWHNLRAALEWQAEMGVTEVMSDTPINRYDMPKAAPKPKAAEKSATAVPTPPAKDDPVVVAKAMAAKARDLGELQQALAAYDHCELHKGARNLVFSDGNPKARVMIIGEAPGREEDRIGKPFVGRAGQLLDKMLAAIGLAREGEDRETGVYITNILPWRPPQNRDPKPDEIAMMMPFVERHVALAAPDVLICMGNISCQAVLGKRGITKLRGQWDQAFDLPVMPMLHPAYLLRQPQAKAQAWKDLLALKAKLRGMADVTH